MGIAKLLDRAVERWPNQVAIRFQGQNLSYSALRAEVDALARSLMELGLKKGDVLSAYLLSNPELIVLYLACFRIGVIILPLSFRLRAKDLTYFIDYAKPKIIVSQDTLLPELNAATPAHHNWQLCLLDMPTCELSRSILSWPGLIERGKTLKTDFPEVHPHDIATYFSTSGTTGLPKLAMHQHHSFLFNAEHHAKLFNYTEQDTTLAPLAICFNLAFAHQFLPALYTGATLELLPTFDPKQVLERIQSGEVTLLYMVAAMYSEVMKWITEGQKVEHRLRACVAGGEALPLALHEKFKEKFGFYINEGIGMTEALFYAINMQQGYKLGSQGQAVLGAQFKIMDRVHPKVLPTGEMGEIWINSPTITCGYLNQPELTQKALVDGWLRTGDLAQVDEEGYLWFRGRISSLIEKAGQQIAPIEIEAAFYQHPSVLQAAVFGVLQNSGQKKIIAYVSLLPDAKVSRDVLMAFIQKSLAAYKLPDIIEILDSLPKGISNKIDRNTLQQKANEEFGK